VVSLGHLFLQNFDEKKEHFCELNFKKCAGIYYIVKADSFSSVLKVLSSQQSKQKILKYCRWGQPKTIPIFCPRVFPLTFTSEHRLSGEMG